MIHAILLAAAVAPSQAAHPGLVEVTASIGPAAITAGAEAAIDVEMTVAEGWSTTEAGMPFALLQIETPEHVTLVGKPTKKQRGEFIDVPHEREIAPGKSRVAFAVDGDLAADARIFLNVVAYLKNEGTGAMDFARVRIALPVRPGAGSSPADPRVSTWGPKGTTLNIGDRAEPLVLPRADSTTVSLEDHLGRTNVLVTTYRAFW
jgi:hypothetical protein